MAEQENSFDVSTQSGASAGNSPCKMLTFEDSPVDNDAFGGGGDAVVKSSEVIADEQRSETSFYDNVSNSPDGGVRGDESVKSECEDVIQSTASSMVHISFNDEVVLGDVAKLRAGSVSNDSSMCDEAVGLAVQMADELHVSEVKRSPGDSLAVEVPSSSCEPRCRDSHESSECPCLMSHNLVHSTPSVHCCADRPVGHQSSPRCELFTCDVAKPVSGVACDQQERLATHCSSQASVAAAVDVTANANAAVEDLSYNEDISTVSAGCEVVAEDFDRNAVSNQLNIELTAAAVTTVDNDGILLTDVTGSHSRRRTTERICQELSEMLLQDCVDNDSRLINCAASDADVSDSFDLDVATKDLERAVSAGMLDFLLESYEDSDDNVSSEKMSEELEEWSSDDSSESTLTDSATDESVVIVVDEDGNKSDEESVSARHERIKRRLNDDAANYSTDGPEAADINCTSSDNSSVSGDDDVNDDNVDENMLRRCERIKFKRHLKDTANDLDNNHCAADGTADVDSVSGNSVSEDDDVDVISVDDMSKACDTCEQSRDSDADNSSADADTCTTNISSCTLDDDDANGSDSVSMRHARGRALETRDCVICRTSDTAAASADISCHGIGVADVSVDDGTSASDDKDIVDTCVVGATEFNNLNLAKDQLSVSDKYVLLSDEVSHSELCIDVENVSSAADVCSQRNVPDESSVVKTAVCNTQSVVSPAVLSSRQQQLLPCQQEPSDAQNTDDVCNFVVGEASLPLRELGAGSTSTPNSCSSQTCFSGTDWHEGVYSGLCHHRDGSQIRMLCLKLLRFFTLFRSTCHCRPYFTCTSDVGHCILGFNFCSYFQCRLTH